ncbi:helix-turn-helix domain-containing protein [Agrobacterium sp. rho-13.3]|uniref:helix-turn-helix domain-containing protein n=1 Tax=Agrobacterium sp. rho-13.3 TaxID=3072980 RepID=UPI002A11DCE5|nr:AraC family transcriptional regulator [Agrobacterium sp. rho-13.3]MDX8307999.1 AraC family transcriptional regulator [Agrobacterium sp. rho-13.3]
MGIVEDLSTRVASGWINLASGMEGCERIEAFFSGPAYQPHRHDTYAIGRTLSGVQRFQYRGQASAGVPGTVIVLHPDELHDGQAGTEDGFHYQMIYLDPLLVQQALGYGHALPFIPQGVSRDPRLLAAIDRIVGHISEPMETLQYDDAVFDIAKALQAAAPPTGRRKISLPDYQAADKARDYLRHSEGQVVSLEQLEALTGRDRWKLSRDFRAVFGTSPYRYLTLRRLDRAKAQIIDGRPLVQVALDAGFADQAHLTRHFRNSFGMTPAQWRKMTLGRG